MLLSFISPQHGGCLLGEVSLQHATSRGWWSSAAPVTQRMQPALWEGSSAPRGRGSLNPAC